MRKVKKAWLLLLALVVVLTCAACGAPGTRSMTATVDKQQAEAAIGEKGGTAKAGAKTDAKTDTKTDAKADTKTDATTDAKADTKTDATTDAKTDAKTDTKTDTKTEDKQQTEAAQTETKQETASKQEIDPDTGKDKYQTDPVPEGKPTPVEPEDTTVDTGTTYTCTFSITCETILDNWDMCDESKKPLVPSDGVILAATTVSFSEGESVYDVLQRVCRKNGIHMESSWTPLYNSAYVEGINNLYEFDVGSLSGWMYEVNGWFPNYGCSRYALQDGDVVHWCYTCDLGYDVGGGYAVGG